MYIYDKEYREWCNNINKEYEEFTKKWRENHPLVIPIRGSVKKKTLKKTLKEKNRAYYLANRERILEKSRIHKGNNKDYFIKYHQDHKEESKLWQNNKWRTDLKYKINKAITYQIGFSLKGNKKGQHWEDLVGYTSVDLIERLKSTMPSGYCWQDYMEGKLHIDHIIPKSVFNFDKPEHIDFKRCWALSNLQLLPAKENFIKHNKLYKPFQPALKI